MRITRQTSKDGNVRLIEYKDPESGYYITEYLVEQQVLHSDFVHLSTGSYKHALEGFKRVLTVPYMFKGFRYILHPNKNVADLKVGRSYVHNDTGGDDDYILVDHILDTYTFLEGGCFDLQDIFDATPLTLLISRGYSL